MQKHVLLTGATGLLGQYLLRDLLLGGRRVAVVVRPSKKATARQRVETIMQRWESLEKRPVPRPVVFEGDVGEDLLGLDAASREWVAAQCDSILHSAALLKFHETGDGEPWKTNIGGTRNVLALCRETEVRDLHYVSTSYVCGVREGTVYEDELDVGQEFRNDYEKSKFQAETLVRRDAYLESLTVYRPAVISGDSVSGFTNTYHGLYLYLRLMCLLVPQQELDGQGRRHTPIRLPMTGDEERNVIPVDWVSRVLTRLFQTPAAHGRTYHLTPERCLTPRKIIEAAYDYLNSTGVEYVGCRQFEPDPSNRFETEMLASFAMYENYEGTDPTFDRTNLMTFVRDLPCPDIDRPMLQRYMEFGEADRWGKRRAPKSTVVVELDPAGRTVHAQPPLARPRPPLKGVILAGGLGRRLHPLTRATNKHLLPVHDRPMIQYPIQTLLNAGIDEILLVTGPRHAGDFLKLLGNGETLGLRTLHYACQEGEGGIADALLLAEDFADGNCICVMLGDNIIERDIRTAVNGFMAQPGGAKILLKEVDHPERFGVPQMDRGRIVQIIEKPADPPSRYAVTGIYMYDSDVFSIARTLASSGRGELEITDLNNLYIRRGDLTYDILEGWWTDAGTFDSLHQVNCLVAQGGANNVAEPLVSPTGQVSLEVRG